MNKYFCNAPFMQTEITPEGACRICCKTSTFVTAEDGVPVKLQDTTLSELWNGEWYTNFRQRFINEEKRPECQQCWDDEDAGVRSYRKQLEYYPADVYNPKLKQLVLKLSNKCNCACRICTFWLSSLWQTELEKTGRWNSHHDYFKENNAQDKINDNWEDWKEHLHTIEQLFLYGGEPLINFEVLKILEYLVENDLAKNISLTMNTNGTVINEKIYLMLKQFKGVFLYFSIDDVFSRYEYERWPSKYNNIFRDLLDLHDNMYTEEDKAKGFYITLYTSISIFNILSLDEILEEFRKFPRFSVNFENLIHEPSLLTVYDLPTTIKNDVRDYLESFSWNHTNWEHPIDYKNAIKNFLGLYERDYSCNEYIQKLDDKLGIDDRRRNQDWQKTFPKLYDLLRKYS